MRSVAERQKRSAYRHWPSVLGGEVGLVGWCVCSRKRARRRRGSRRGGGGRGFRAFGVVALAGRRGEGGGDGLARLRGLVVCVRRLRGLPGGGELLLLLPVGGGESRGRILERRILCLRALV
jgi:hypothetical protein